MAGRIVGRHCRSGQDEQSGLVGVSVHFAPDLIPDRGHELPLVDQARTIALEQHGRRHEPRRPSLVVHVEANFAPGSLTRGLCLAAPARALDEHGACGTEAGDELRVYDARPIRDGRLNSLVGVESSHLQRLWKPKCSTSSHPFVVRLRTHSELTKTDGAEGPASSNPPFITDRRLRGPAHPAPPRTRTPRPRATRPPTAPRPPPAAPCNFHAPSRHVWVVSHPPVGREPLEHAQARRLLDAYLVDDLAAPDAARLAAHVETCPTCAAEIGGAARLLALLGSLPTPEPSPDLDERILLAAIRDRERRHEHRSWLATLRTQIFRGAVRTTGTLVVAIVTVAFLGAAFVLAAGLITELAFTPVERGSVGPDMTPTPAPTLSQTAAPATTSPAVIVEATPEPTPAPVRTPAITPAPTAEPTPVATPAPTATPEPTVAPTATPSPTATAEPTPTPTPAPSPTEKPRRTPPPSASPSPTPTPAPTEAPSPTSP